MLRDFRPQDQVDVRALVLAGLRERWGDSFDPNFNADLDDIQAVYVDRGAEVVVVESDGCIIATGTMIFERPAQARIVRMSVAAAHRRQGLGAKIVEELIARAQTKGLRTLEVFTDTPWASAVALYEACGFTTVSRDRRDTYFSMELTPSVSDVANGGEELR